MPNHGKALYALFVFLAISIFVSQHVNVLESTKSELILTVQTDKPYYLPGEIVSIFGTVQDSSDDPIADATISIEVKDHKSNTIFLDIVFSTSDGTYEDSFRLDQNAPFGDYTVFVTATAEGYPTAMNQTTFTVGIHDISVIDLTSSKQNPTPGETIYINVTVENQGNFTETFDVSVYYTRLLDPLLGTQTATLDGGDNITLTFEWTPNMTGRYEIRAEASEVPNEVDTTDNTRTTFLSVGYGGSNPGSHNGGSINGLHIVGFIFAMFGSIMVLAFRKNRKVSFSNMPASIVKQNLRTRNNTIKVWDVWTKQKPT